MTTLDRAIWLAGLLALVGLVIYWPTIKKAWQNRDKIAAASDALAELGLT